jgi:hypothetical protein
MKTKDFEKAIEALGLQSLEVLKYSYGVNGQVVAVYAKLGDLTHLMWDTAGRGFRFDIEEGMEGCRTTPYPEYLDYRRDVDFDLKFD